MKMIIHPIPPLADVLGGSLGVAALILVIAWAGLAWQRNRHRFVLMRTALEKGITRFPDAPPFWLVSLRQGVSTLALGVALAVVGGGAFWLGHGVAMPTQAELSTPATTQPAMEPLPEPSPPGPGHPPHPRPPAPNPQLEQWHQAQTETVVGLTSIGIGIILAFVGIVRITFARAEHAYAREQEIQG